MGEAKHRRKLGLGPRVNGEHTYDKESAISFEDAHRLTERDGITCWTWKARREDGAIVGADTYVSYKGDDEESDGEAFVREEGDDWNDPEVGEEGDIEMSELPAEIKSLPWYRALGVNPFDLPDFSFLKLRALGCTEPTVIAISREFDRQGD